MNCPPTFNSATHLMPMPRGFRAAGRVLSAKRCLSSPVKNLRSPGVSRAQKAGKRYEKKLFPRLRALEPLLEVHPWLEYTTNQAHSRFCQPDALLETELYMYIIELKYSHCELAYWQLKHLYAPVVAKLTSKPLRLVEITRSFDPSVVFPCEMRLFFEWKELVYAVPSLGSPVEVLQWKI